VTDDTMADAPVTEAPPRTPVSRTAFAALEDRGRGFLPIAARPAAGTPWSAA